MAKSELQELLKKYRERTCSEDEKRRLIDWYKQYDQKAESMPAVSNTKLDQLWDSINSEINFPKSKKSIRHVYIPMAAVIAVVLAVAVNIFLQNPSGIHDIMDQAEKAVMPNCEIVKLDVGQNREIILPDGSKVFLNSCSSLKYPVVFTEDKREVELEGEAFFEVKKGNRPFIVKTSDIDIRVYGTSFNVCSYQEDHDIVTALVTGNVHVYDRNRNKDYGLIPGMALAFGKDDGSIAKKEVDMNLYTSWRKGEFMFSNMRLEDILNRMKHWYAYEIIYTDESVKDIRLCGTAEKKNPVSYFLQMLEVVSPVKFTLIDGQLRVERK